MGRDKALLRIGGLTLLERAVRVVREAGGLPLVLGPPRPGEDTGGAPHVDETAGAGGPGGPLPALRRGLLESGPAGRAVALACDLPLVPAALLRFLAASLPGWDAVVPRAAGELQVLAAAYDGRCLAAIDRALARGERALHPFLREVRVRIVDEDQMAPFGGAAIFLNVNTPEDLSRAEAALAAGRP
jgi:molybdopterin-guanine dinucleotide biosynthesis protein A